jgi:hypothetical protein
MKASQTLRRPKLFGWEELGHDDLPCRVLARPRRVLRYNQPAFLKRT